MQLITRTRVVIAAIAVVTAACGASPTLPLEDPDEGVEDVETKPTAAPEVGPLAGSHWVATEIDGQAIAPDVDFAVAFESVDQVSGIAGCNRFFGAYSTDGDAIAFGHLGATQMMCPPEQMELEQRFLDLLARAERFERRAGELVLSTGEPVQKLTLTRAEPSPLVTGAVLYRERIALPPEARLTVRLVDMENMAVLGEQVVHPTGQVPIPFEIAYDPAQVEAERSYAVQATIDAGGEEMFASPRPVPVITGGYPVHDVEVLVERVEPPPEPAQP